MASPKPQVSDSAASSCSVQVMDSIEPLVPTAASSCSVQVLDSIEPLVPTTDAASLDELPDCSRMSPSVDNVAAMANLVMPAPEAPLARPAPGSSGRRVNLYAEELRTMWNWRKIFKNLGTPEQCTQFAEEQELLPTQKMCGYHRRPMTLNAGQGQFGIFRCRKSNCRTKTESRAQGTWFENVRLPITLVFEIMYAFSEGLSYEQTRKQIATEENDTVLSPNTVADWYSYCRETIVVYELEHQEEYGKIGGPNKVVQIDESKFGKRKYNRGRHIEGHWVIGMIEDGNDDLRLEVCPDNERTAEVLVPLIKKHVEEGSIVHTDFWRAYLSLPDHGYTHKRVNHSDPTNRFVAPDGTHTQRIERQWRGMKKAFRQEQNKRDFTDWLVEYSWRRKIRIHHRDPFEELIKAVQYVYKKN